MAGAQQKETVRLADGSTIDLARLPNIDDSTWNDVKKFIQSNPSEAKKLQSFAKNPDSDAIRSCLRTQVMAQHYEKKLAAGDNTAKVRMNALKDDPELAHIFADIEKNGAMAILKYGNDEELMCKISRAMGGIPSDVQPSLRALDETSLTFHDACRNGDFKAVETYLSKETPVNDRDFKGISPLGYAIGANRIAIAKLLLDRGATQHAVDAAGNSGLHYAAGYGHKELADYLLRKGARVNQANAKGETPLKAAMLNKQMATIQVLESHGGQA